MKKVFLFGDSIRKGYDRYVKESMVNVANVYFHEENSRFTEYVLRCLHLWKDDLKLGNVDAVHWNVGLWDTLRIYNDECLTRPDVYAYNIERIFKRIEFLFPGAKQIFATSTPVIEDGYIKDFEMRYNKDVEIYNQIAIDVLEKHDVIINDLYGLLRDKSESLHSDQTHYYTAEATWLIGTQVNNVICDAIGLDKTKIIIPDKKKFEITSLKNDNELYIKNGDYYELVEGI